MPRPAARADIAAIRAHLEAQPNPPNLPEDDDVAGYFDRSVGNVARIGDTGEFGQAHWSEVNGYSTIVWLLPEGMNMGRLAPLLLDLLDALWAEFPASQSQLVEATFHHGLDDVTGEEDYGWGKANAWADFVERGGGGRPLVEEAYNSNNVRTGTRAWMQLALVRGLLGKAIRGN